MSFEIAALFYEANKPTVSGKEASRTPIEFRDTLLNLARLSVCSS
jgi:hypothetical protein